MEVAATWGNWAEESQELFTPSTYAEAIGSDGLSNVNRRRKRDAPTPASSDEELPTPAKHFASTPENTSEPTTDSLANFSTPETSTQENPTADQPLQNTPTTENSSPETISPPTPAVPTVSPSSPGLNDFLNALESVGKNRTLLMAAVPGPFFLQMPGPLPLS